jgi:hypothetical protein
MVGELWEDSGKIGLSILLLPVVPTTFQMFFTVKILAKSWKNPSKLAIFWPRFSPFSPIPYHFFNGFFHGRAQYTTDHYVLLYITISVMTPL